MKKGIIILIVAVILGFMGWKLFSNKQKIDSTKEEQSKVVEVSIPVNVITADFETINNNLNKTGKLIPFREANIAALTAGKLTSLNFNLGSYVTQGTTIAQVDSRTLNLNLNLAKQNRDKAQRDYKRYETLLQGEATTETTYQDAKLNYVNSQNQIELLEKQIADTRITAPISGQVVSKNIENGEFVSVGTPLGKIVDLSRLKVRVMVSEADVYSLRLGQAVKVTTDIYPNTTFNGKISFISGEGDATFNYEVEITLDNNKKDAPLKAGTFAYVDFNQTSNINGIVIPRTALVESLQNPFVYIVKNNILEKRQIVVAKDLGNQIVVESGINKGDVIVTSGLVNVREGSKVKPITNTTTATKK